jgi:hypothetical protein
VISALNEDIELLCSSIKHSDGEIDLDYVRGVLRRAQLALGIPTGLKHPDELNIERRSRTTAYSQHEVTIRVTVADEELGPLVAWLIGIEEE